MNKIIFFFLLFSINAFAQTAQEVTAKDGSKKLLGRINVEALQNSPYKEWFQPQYDSYIVEEQKLMPFSKALNKVSIKIFMGTWCGDTKREVPRFLKVLDSQKFNHTQLEIYCLDNGDNGAYKQSPQHEEKGLSIHRVPTFIFYENNKEIGRIIESPVVSFEQDIVNILNQNRYSPNYNYSTYSLKLIDAGYFNYFEEHSGEFADEWRNMIKSSSELNSVGYVLLDQKKTKEAIGIFTLNTKLYPNVSNVYDSLAEAYEKDSNKEKAILNYKKAVEINPKAENAIEKLKELQK